MNPRLALRYFACLHPGLERFSADGLQGLGLGGEEEELFAELEALSHWPGHDTANLILESDAGKAAFSETHDQLAGWLFALLVNYGLRFTQETKAAFLDDALEPGAVVIRVPCAYFRCSDQPEAYLKFDPDGWIRAAGFFEGGR